MAIPAGFFDLVVNDIARYYGVRDGNDLPVQNDQTISLSVLLAYHQIIARTRVAFHLSRRVVCYEEVHAAVSLMHKPVVEVHSVAFDGVTATVGSDYVISGGILYFGDQVDPAQCLETPRAVTTDITAGIEAVDDENPLYAPLMIQGIANFNRKDLFGFSQTVSGERGAQRVASDSGGIVKAVAEMIEPLTYYGLGRVCQ